MRAEVDAQDKEWAVRYVATVRPAMAATRFVRADGFDVPATEENEKDQSNQESSLSGEGAAQARVLSVHGSEEGAGREQTTHLRDSVKGDSLVTSEDGQEAGEGASSAEALSDVAEARAVTEIVEGRAARKLARKQKKRDGVERRTRRSVG
ncbi:hypothetical protein GN958_ATG01904 [Phytophthora infestans]|uniref:Uncharacterized protein n=1 Tax=Phytophthora infestans TaxID=4787 RepID=A0A8S9V7C5_PHYIN|nr:hypothetical protein GN958_ATG01904 [Phytophthora infestans]